MFAGPLNIIASKRSDSFLEHLPSLGIQIDLITRYFDEEQIKGSSFQSLKKGPKAFKENYIKILNKFYTNFDEFPFWVKAYNFTPSPFKSLISFFSKDISFLGWKKYVIRVFEKELINNKYDFILASFGPPIVLEAAKVISKKFNIPMIADYRDLHLEDKQRFWKARIFQQHILLKDCAGLTFVCAGMKAAFDKNATEKLRNLPYEIVQNGVDLIALEEWTDNDYAIVKSIKNLKNTYQVILIHTGTIYSGQRISYFFDAVKSFNSKNSGVKAAIVLVGHKNKESETLEQSEYIHYFSSISHSASLHLQKWASALLLPSWPGRYTGFSGKMLEYIYSGNQIICSPNPPEDAKEFFKDFKTVFISNTIEDLNEVFLKLAQKGNNINYPYCNQENLFRMFWIKKLSIFLFRLKYSIQK